MNSDLLLISMPFNSVKVIGVQLPILETYAAQQGIAVESRYLYLKYADTLGVYFYDKLAFKPYYSEIFFSALLFPEHFYDRFSEIKHTFADFLTDEEIQKIPVILKKVSDQIIQEIQWTNYKLVGFTINYGQLIPSLYMARQIKKSNPEVKIVFGGSRVTGALGVNILTHSEVDFAISNDGEEALCLLYKNLDQPDYFNCLPGLIYRQGEMVQFNPSGKQMNLNTLPTCNYDSYFNELHNSSSELQNYTLLNAYLPIEFSRGCWWKKCSFCNLNLQHQKYRQKPTEKTVKELIELSNKYLWNKFIFTDNCVPRNALKDFLNKLIESERDFEIFMELRAGVFERKDFPILRKAGVKMIQVGVESFSNSLLEKMKKGTTAIENIAILKYCQENNIYVDYNLITSFPTESEADIEETKEAIGYLRNLQPPFSTNFKLGYQSEVYNHLEAYNIATIEVAQLDRLIYPEELQKKIKGFYYDYTLKEGKGLPGWDEVIDSWRVSFQKTRSKHPLKYWDCGRFINIQNQIDNNDFLYKLSEKYQCEIFRSCGEIREYDEILQLELDVSIEEINEFLEYMVEEKLFYKEGNKYLALPIRVK